MTDKSIEDQAWKSMLEDHRELMQQITDVREWAKQVSDFGVPHFGELGSRLQPLRDALAKHFQEEEAGGYLSEVLAIAPRYSREADKLQQQHGDLLVVSGTGPVQVIPYRR